MAEIIRKIALLSTGDEITNGNIVNTNSQVIAEGLFEQCIQPGLHLTASDDQIEIEKAIRFLLSEHAGLIITGGLGPTSDDRTRFALANVIGKELVFDEDCWRRIVERLQRLNLPIPDSNRQQCLFPPQALIFPNQNGTASGCLVSHHGQPIFMLPGPPFECMPIFAEQVLPYLQAEGYARPLFRCEWLLLGVSEGSIAAQLDPLAESSGCYVGYRVNQPYLEVKLQAAEQAVLEQLRKKFADIIGSYSVSDAKQKASTQLKQFAIRQSCRLSIDDTVTGGLLAAALLTPESYPYIRFTAAPDPATDIQIILSGMENYWRGEKTPSTLNIEIITGQASRKITRNIPFRQERTPLWAMEIASWEILNELKTHFA